jgi:hypothetical protein
MNVTGCAYLVTFMNKQNIQCNKNPMFNDVLFTTILVMHCDEIYEDSSMSNNLIPTVTFNFIR